ncbi:hypothetical protein MFMK1_002757 [Metallumcola ferriviriculae]|uniref:Uncharacterized protein n=1 Tax=Metallumcola ferriviriculae TaxID=3039180 RepID=A0AAU0UNN9_9FIRM|nr:hypothetical protein MFMK1_002757 [Desulfitibacteraceae bacterium MK1]
MVKVVSIFPENNQAMQTVELLAGEDISDGMVTDLTGNYEEQIKHEIFLTARELRWTLVGGLIGAILLGLLFFLVALGEVSPPLLLPLAAAGPYAAAFTGVGTGVALGALLTGLWALQLPLQADFSGGAMLILYCHPNKKRKAIKLIAFQGGKFV